MSIYHAVGSAAMGPEDDDVVAPDLRVRGVEVCGSLTSRSCLTSPRATPQPPAMALGWLAADVIRATS